MYISIHVHRLDKCDVTVTNVSRQVYRPHIDGAWPGSGIDEQGNYIYDAFVEQPAQARHSRLTFLIYLNDGTFVLGRCLLEESPTQKESPLRREFGPLVCCALKRRVVIGSKERVNTF